MSCRRILLAGVAAATLVVLVPGAASADLGDTVGSTVNQVTPPPLPVATTPPPVVSTTVRPVVSAVVKPTVTSVAQPVVKPVAPVVRPVAAPVVKAVAKPVVKAVAPVVQPVVQPVVKAATAPVATAARSVTSSARSSVAPTASAPSASAARTGPARSTAGGGTATQRSGPAGTAQPRASSGGAAAGTRSRAAGPATASARSGSALGAAAGVLGAVRSSAQVETRAHRPVRPWAGQELRSLADSLVGAAALTVPRAGGVPFGDDLQLPSECLTSSLDLDVLRRCALAQRLGGTGGFLVGLLPTGMALVASGTAVLAWSRRRRWPGSPVPA